MTLINFGPLFLLLLVIAWFFFIPAVMQWLWNMTMPELFGFKTIRYWQSFRLIIIASILTGGPLLGIGFNSN